MAVVCFREEKHCGGNDVTLVVQMKMCGYFFRQVFAKCMVALPKSKGVKEEPSAAGGYRGVGKVPTVRLFFKIMHF